MDRLIEILLDAFEKDVQILSMGMMYVPFLIPAMLYGVAMILKWSLISIPFWLPVCIVAVTLKHARSRID